MLFRLCENIIKTYIHKSQSRKGWEYFYSQIKSTTFPKAYHYKTSIMYLIFSMCRLHSSVVLLWTYILKGGEVFLCLHKLKNNVSKTYPTLCCLAPEQGDSMMWVQFNKSTGIKCRMAQF